MSFVIRCSLSWFSEEEIQTLKRFGKAFQDLTTGRRTCKTPGQEQFVEVAKGHREPETDYERVWRKYLARVALERRNPGLRTKTNAPKAKGGRRTVNHPLPAVEPIRNVPNDREDWKRMRRRQWGDAMRRSRGD